MLVLARGEAGAGLLLIAAAAVALILANSPLAGRYHAVFTGPILYTPIAKLATLDLWVNDALMAVFFFVVGLEIKRELHAGELSELRRAALPAFAALGGMIVPAIIYMSWNAGTPASGGWGVPMATDIAFAVGALTLLGKRVPPALRILLLALAVIDDLGAIIVIALFYSGGIKLAALGVAGAGILLILLMQKLRFRSPWAYVIPGIVIWAGTLASGVHPTIAGVVIGLCTPVRAPSGQDGPSPAERIQQALHRWVAFGIMPVFALVNAGVSVGDARLTDGGATLLIGVVVGLAVGKPIGVMCASWIAVRAGVAALPAGVRWSGVFVVGLLAGIGFTMALFIATLAFPPGPLIEVAKLGIMLASLVAGVIGLAAGRWLLPGRAQP